MGSCFEGIVHGLEIILEVFRGYQPTVFVILGISGDHVPLLRGAIFAVGLADAYSVERFIRLIWSKLRDVFSPVPLKLFFWFRHRGSAWGRSPVRGQVRAPQNGRGLCRLRAR